MDLLEETKRNEDVRSLFGKRELFIIQKQLWGVKLSPSEKTRLSRDIRKKFRAVKALAKHEREFDIKYGFEVNEIIKDTKEFLLQSKYANNIKKIVVFGSTTLNLRTLISDIDIAVEFGKITTREASQFRLDMMSKVHKNVDIRVYNVVPKNIQQQIDAHGKVIYRRKN